MAEEKNPFHGMSYGRAVDLMLRDPTQSLDAAFDAQFPDDERVDALERARRHAVNSYYRNTTNGAASLKFLHDLVTNPPEIKEIESTPATEAQDAWAQRLARGVKRGEEFKSRTAQQGLDEAKERYNNILDDLANYERMEPAEGLTQSVGALLGTLAGGVPSFENAASFPLKGVTAVARMLWGGFQAGAVNTVVDPITQALNMSTNIQAEFKPVQTILAFPMGAVIGGGLVGAGEVISRSMIQNGLRNLGRSDPAIDPEAELRALFDLPGETKVTLNGQRLTPDGQVVPERITVEREMPEEIISTEAANKIRADEEMARTVETQQVPKAEDGTIPSEVPRTEPPVQPRPIETTTDPTAGLIPPETPLAVPVKIGDKTFTTYEELQTHLSQSDAQADLIKQLESELSSARPPAEPVETFIIEDFLGAKADTDTMEVRVLRKDGEIDAIDTDAGIVKVAPAYRKMSAEEAIANTLGSHTQQGKADVSKVRRIDEKPAVVTPAAAPVTPPPAPKKPEWTKVGEQKGSNTGGTYTDTNGVKWYIKNPPSESHIRNEQLGNRLYALAGTNVPETKLVNLDGKQGIGSKLATPEGNWLELNAIDPQSKVYKDFVTKIKGDFAVDAWLANWDVIGLNKDNILVSLDGAILRIDQGGSLIYRAQGDLKPDFGPKVGEFLTMRDKKTDAGKIFHDMTDQELIDSIDKLAAFQPSDIDIMVAKYGPADPNAQMDLASTLQARRKDLLEIRDNLNLLSFPTTPKGKVLPMDPKSQIARAKKQGYDTNQDWIHSTPASPKKLDEEGFNLKFAKNEKAIFITQAENTHLHKAYGHNTIFLWSRAKKIKVIEAKDGQGVYTYMEHNIQNWKPEGQLVQSWDPGFFKSTINQARKDGFDAVHFKSVKDVGGVGDQMAVLKTNLLRNKKAAFDPKQKTSSKLVALEDPSTAALEEPKVKPETKADEGDEFDLDAFYAQARDDDLLYDRYMREGWKGGEDLKERTAELRAVPLQGELPKAPNFVAPPEVVQSLHQMTDDLVRVFGETIRQGGLKKGNLGEYDINDGVIRVRGYPDFQVNAHEVAHSLANKLTGDIHLQGTDPLSQYAQTSGLGDFQFLDYNQDPIKGQRVSEGFAEFIRLFMTNPGHLQSHVPNTYAMFLSIMDQTQPQTLQSLIGFQKAFESYLAAPPEQTSLAAVYTPKATWGQWLVGRFTDAKVAPTPGNILSNFYQAAISQKEDWFTGTRAIQREINKEHGTKYTDLLPSEDPRIFMRMLEKFTQTAMSMARGGIIPYRGFKGEGPSLTQVLVRAFNQNSLLGTWNEELFKKFGAYTIARRAVGLWDQRARLKHDPTDELRGEHQALIDQYDIEYPQFREASDMLNQFNRNMLRRMQESGAFYGLNREALEKIIASEEFYVPFNRRRDHVVGGKGGGGGAFPGGIKSLHGSALDIINPINSIMNQLMMMEKQIAHADAVRAMVALAGRAGSRGGKFVEVLPAHEVRAHEIDLRAAFTKAMVKEGKSPDIATADSMFDSIFGTDPVTGVDFKMQVRNGRNEPIVFWTDDGVLKAARFSTKEDALGHGLGLYEALMAAPKPAADIGTQLLGFGAQVLVGSITTHWAYALRNVFRDQFAAAAFVPGYIPGYHAIKGMKHVISDDEFAKAYREFGGVNPAGAINPNYADAVEADVQALVSAGFTVRKILSWKGVVEGVASLEMASRLGALEVLYKQKKRSGLSDYDAWLSATNETADLLPFDRVGGKMSTTRQLIPFMNAWIQALDKANRQMNVPIKRAINSFFGGEDIVARSDWKDAGKALYAWGTLGAVGYGMGYMFAAMLEGEKGYENLSARTKAVNFAIPVGDNQLILFPKPWELSLGFTAGEYAYAALKRNDPRAAAQFLTAVKETLQSPNPLWGNPLVGTSYNLLANYNTFTGGPIVSPTMARKLESEQFDAKTSGLAKRVGEITGWSPKKVDFALSGYFGYWGRDLATLGRGNQSPDTLRNLKDAVLDRAGLRDAEGVSDVSEKFFKYMGRTTGSYAKSLETYRQYAANPATQYRARELFQAFPENIKAYVILNVAGNAQGKDAFTADQRRLHPLTRAMEASTIAMKMKADVESNIAMDLESRATLVVNETVRKKVARVLGQLGAAELSNSLTIIKEPGYANETLVDPDVYMEQLKVLDPKIAAELQKRYSTKKIYNTENVARIYEPMRDELLRAGSQARLGALAHEATRGGFEFGGVRRKTPKQYKMPIEGVQ